MNLLFATNRNPFGLGPFGGAETSTRLLAERMSAKGHNVHYVTRPGDTASLELASNSGVELHYFPRKHRVIGIPKHRVERYLRKITFSKLVKRHEIDIVYAFYELNVIEPLLDLPNRLIKPKVIMRMAGLRWYVESSKDNGLRDRYQKVFRDVDSVNYIEDGFVPLVEAKLAELDFTTVFKHSFSQDIGSSTEAQRSTPYKSASDGLFRMLMVARFSDYQKRQDLLVKAIALMPRDLKLQMTFVGEGRLREEIRNLAEELNVSDRIRFLDFMDQTALWELMESSQLMCHATDFEGLGKSVVEAMHKGLPVLASRVAPLDTYIRHGDNGFLVENAPEAWASQMIALAQAPEMLAEVSKASLHYAQQKWDPEKCADVFEATFAEVAERQVV